VLDASQSLRKLGQLPHFTNWDARVVTQLLPNSENELVFTRGGVLRIFARRQSSDHLVLCTKLYANKHTWKVWRCQRSRCGCQTKFFLAIFIHLAVPYTIHVNRLFRTCPRAQRIIIYFVQQLMWLIGSCGVCFRSKTLLLFSKLKYYDLKVEIVIMIEDIYTTIIHMHVL
jgi:hypothetical protein